MSTCEYKDITASDTWRVKVSPKCPNTESPYTGTSRTVIDPLGSLIVFKILRES